MEDQVQVIIPDEWEGIVNNVERHNDICRLQKNFEKRKLRKNIKKAMIYAIGAALSMALESVGMLTLTVAVAASVALLCLTCFTAGQIVENWKVYNGTKERNTY